MTRARPQTDEPRAPGLTAVIAALAGLFAVGLMQAWFVWVNVDGLRQINPELVENGRDLIAVCVSICLLKSAGALIAAGLLAFVRRPVSILAAVLALWFWWPLADLLSWLALQFMANGPLLRPYLPGTGYFFPPLVVAATLYLFLSEGVARRYGTGTRALILTLRGR